MSKWAGKRWPFGFAAICHARSKLSSGRNSYDTVIERIKKELQ
jgi:hypothetical protein